MVAHRLMELITSCNKYPPYSSSELNDEVLLSNNKQVVLYGFRLKILEGNIEINFAGNYLLRHVDKYCYNLKAFRQGAKGSFLKTGDSVLSYTVDGRLMFFKDKKQAEDFIQSAIILLTNEMKVIQEECTSILEILTDIQLP